MGCCCWSLPVGENPPTMYNAESISTDGDLRWAVLWEAIMPNQGGMQVLRDRYGRYVIREMSGELVAVGVKDDNIHVASLDTSDGSESLALTDTGVAADCVVGASGEFRGEAREVSGEIVISAYKVVSTYVWKLVRIAVAPAGTCTRTESNDINYTPSASLVTNGLGVPSSPRNHFQTPRPVGTVENFNNAFLWQYTTILGVSSTGEAMLLGERYRSQTDTSAGKVVSVDSSGESGRITTAVTAFESSVLYPWFGSTGNAYWVRSDDTDGFGLVIEFFSSSSSAPFSSRTTLVQIAQSLSGSDRVPFVNGFVVSPRGAATGWGYSIQDNLGNTDEILTVYDPSVNFVTTPPTKILTEVVCPNINNPGVTNSTSQKIESDGTLHIVLCSAVNTNRTSTTDAGYGIVNDSGVEAVMLTNFPNHISGTGAKLSLDNDDNACCYWRTNRGDSSGYMAGLYKRYSGVILQEWAWFNLNELVDDVDASGNFYFADETPHEQSGLGKDEPLSFTLLLDDTTWTFSNIGDPLHETWWRSNLNDQLLAYATGGTLTSQIDDTYSGGTSMLIDFELTISAGTTAGTALLTLDVVIDLTTELGGNGVNGGISDVTVTYTLDNVDISTAQTVELTTAASVAARTLTFDAGPPAETILLPATLDVQIS